MKLPTTPRAWLALACAILTLVGVTVGISHVNGATTVTITVNTPTGPTEVTAKNSDIEAMGRVAEHDGLNRPASAASGAAANVVADRIAARNPLSPLAPLAAPLQPGCRSQFVRSSFGSRYGTKPQWIVSHYTAGPNLPGFRDLNALTAYSNNTQNGVSWHYNLDREGNCVYTVRETQSAWTQAAANRLSIGIEIVNRGAGDAPLFTKSGLKKYARIVSDIAYRWRIPIQRGKANKSTCAVIRRGLIDHNDLGLCGGNHFDITPYKIESIIAAVRAHRETKTRRINYPGSYGPKRRAWCKDLAVVRKNAKKYGGWTEPRRTAARSLKVDIGRGQHRCKFLK